MLRSGINSELFKVVSSPPEWVSKLDEAGSSPYFLTKQRDLIESFLSATTDSVRLVRASKASREILDEYDMAELEDLRATVQASELLRVIPYPRQTDHSAHTLYLFLLGIYLFFACAPLRKEITSFLDEKEDSAKLLHRFLFQWVFVSLLHDIGYIFQGRSGSEIRAVDRMFRASTIKRLISEEDEDLKQRVGEFIMELPLKPFEPIQNPEDMLSALRYMPWGESAEFDNDIFESFAISWSQEQEVSSSYLEDYVYRVASTGYDGFSDGTVDHAVASGLFLFRYSTFWFWLAKKIKFKGQFERFRDGGYPKTDVAHACFAAAAHNIIGVHATECDPLGLEANPMIYLGILCDELQKWDRFPAGERHIVDLQSFEKYCTDSERITVARERDREEDGNWDHQEVILRFEQEDLAAGIKKALERLDSAESFIKINPDVSPKATPSGKENQSEESSPPAAQLTPPSEDSSKTQRGEQTKAAIPNAALQDPPTQEQ